MRLYRIDKEIDFPEKVSRAYGNAYLNVRSIIRIDVRPQETILVPTGFRVSFLKKQRVYSVNKFNGGRYELTSGELLYIEITNETKNNYKISPGQAIGHLEVYK